MTMQQEIIKELGVLPTIDPKEEVRKSIDFLKAYLQKNPFLHTFVLGISGGQDSTLAGRIAQLTMEEMRSETGNPNYQFIGVRLPYGEQADEEDAKKAIEFIKPDIELRVNIKAAVDAQVQAVEEAGLASKNKPIINMDKNVFAIPIGWTSANAASGILQSALRIISITR